MTAEEEIRHLRAALVRPMDKELAYNGDPNPRRMGTLTPRQRDIVCRILQDVKYAALLPARARYKEGDEGLVVTQDDIDGLMFQGEVAGRPRGGVRLDLDELKLLADAMRKITPRRGD